MEVGHEQYLLNIVLSSLVRARQREKRIGMDFRASLLFVIGRMFRKPRKRERNGIDILEPKHESMELHWSIFVENGHINSHKDFTLTKAMR